MSTMGYVSTLEGAAESASLSLDFEKEVFRVREGGKLTSKKLSDIVTTERGTGAGRWNSKGSYEMVGNDQPRLDYDPVTKLLKGLLSESTTTNLTTYSENFLSTSWAKTAGWIELVGASPMGKSYKYTASTAVAAHFLQKVYSGLAAGTFTTTRLMKAGELTKVRCQLYGTGAFAAADFDLVAGTVAASVGTATITHVGDGWYLCSCTGKWTSTETILDRWYPMRGLETSFAGNGVDGYYIANSQVELSPFASYYLPSTDSLVSRPGNATYFDKDGVLRIAGSDVARTDTYIYDQAGKLVPVGLFIEASPATNRLRASSDYSLTSAWAKSPPGLRITPGGKAPDGSVASRITLMGTVGHNINQVLDAPLLTSSTYTLSVWLRAVKGTFSFQLAYYDLSASVNSVGSELTTEWKRHKFTFTPAAVAASPQIRLVGYSNGADGDVFEMFGAQLEVGDTATSYIPTGASFTSRSTPANFFDNRGLMQSAAANVARGAAYGYDADGVLRPVGLLLEGSGTNVLPYSSDLSQWGQAGGGANFTITPNAGDGPRGPGTMTLVRRTDLTLGKYIAKSFSGPSGTITYSHYVKRASPLSKFFSVRMQAGNYADRFDVRFDLNTGEAIANMTGNLTSVVAYTENMGNGLFRCIVVASAPTAWSIILFSPMDRAAAADSTPNEISDLYIDAGQIEASPYVTSYIATQASAVTRAADIYGTATATRAAEVSTSSQTTKANDQMYSLNVTPWINQSAGTLVASGSFQLGSEVQNKHMVNLRGPKTADWLGIRHATGILQAGSANSSGAGSTIIAGVQVPTGVTFKTALRYANNDAAFTIDGALIGTDTSCPYPLAVPFDRLSLGGFSSGTLNMCGHIKSFTYYPVGLSNSQLQMVSS